MRIDTECSPCGLDAGTKRTSRGEAHAGIKGEAHPYFMRPCPVKVRRCRLRAVSPSQKNRYIRDVRSVGGIGGKAAEVVPKLLPSVLRVAGQSMMAQ